MSKRISQFAAWAGSDWRLSISMFLILAGCWYAGMCSQSLLGLIEEDRAVRQEGAELVESIRQQPTLLGRP